MTTPLLTLKASLPACLLVCVSPAGPGTTPGTGGSGGSVSRESNGREPDDMEEKGVVTGVRALGWMVFGFGRQRRLDLCACCSWELRQQHVVLASHCARLHTQVTVTAVCL